MPDWEARYRLVEEENHTLRERIAQLEEVLSGAARNIRHSSI